MKKTKRLLMMIMSLVLVLTMAQVTAFARYSVSSVEESEVTDITQLVLNKQYEVSLSPEAGKPEGTKWYKFTPEITDNYYFSSTGECDTYGTLYQFDNGTYNKVASNDDSATSRNFCLTAKLEAGTTYYYCVSLYDGNVSGTFNVMLEKRKDITKLEVIGATEGIYELDFAATVEVKLTYDDNSVFTMTISSYPSPNTYEPDREYLFSSRKDKYGYEIGIFILGKYYNDIINKVSGTYPVQIAIVDEEGNKTLQRNYSIDCLKMDDYFKNAPKLECGTVLESNSPYEYIYPMTPYIVEIEENGYYYLQNKSSNERGVNVGLALIYKDEDGNVRWLYCYTMGPTMIDKGTYYALFIEGEKNLKTVFGAYSGVAYVPAKAVTAPTSLQMEVNAIKNLGAKIVPEISKDKITYFSSNPKVATVDIFGNVTAIAPGTATITVVANKKIAKCTVTVTKNEASNPPAVVKPGKVTKLTVKNNKKGSVSVKFNKAKNAKKYIVKYSTDKKFKKGVKTKTITRNSCTIKKLKKGKTYYVKVCAVNGKAKSSFTRAKRVKIKK